MPKQSLTDRGVSLLKPKEDKRTDYFDTQQPAFGLRVSPSGSKKWFVAVRPPQGGNPRRITFGSYPATKLKEARSEARHLLEEAGKGRDPKAILAARKSQNVEAAQKTYASIRSDYIEKRARKDLKPSTLRELESLLEHSVLSSWESRPIADITTLDVKQALSTLADTAPTRSNRLRAYLSGLFGWAMDRGIREDNPVSNTKPLTKERSRDRVLSDKELKAILKAADNIPYPGGPFIKALALTGQRRAEVAGMTWDELDLKGKEPAWSLKAERTKNKRDHIVPLSKELVALLQAQPEIGAHVFSGTGKTPFSGFSKLKTQLDDLSAVKDWTWHDLRRTFATRLAELKIAPHVIEAALNHVSGHKAGVAGVYNRASYAEEKRAAITAWSKHCRALEKATDESNVVRISK